MVGWSSWAANLSDSRTWNSKKVGLRYVSPLQRGHLLFLHYSQEIDSQFVQIKGFSGNWAQVVQVKSSSCVENGPSEALRRVYSIFYIILLVDDDFLF